VVEGRVLTCVYCGQAYPQDTPAWGSEVLTAHVRVCEKHPMRELEARYSKVRGALAALVGVDTREELDAMDAVIRMAVAPAEDKVGILDAIHVLRATLPSSDEAAGPPPAA